MPIPYCKNLRINCELPEDGYGGFALHPSHSRWRLIIRFLTGYRQIEAARGLTADYQPESSQGLFLTGFENGREEVGIRA